MTTRGSAVQVIHLPPGGLIGRHVATGPQLFAVVAGTGWVSGQDVERREIGPGYAALWAAGEDHEAHSDNGLTAVCVEGEFETWATAVTTDIVVSDYDPAWPGWFDTVRRRVWSAISDVAVRIDHVGSTAVPGLAAKPIIDIDIVVPRRRPSRHRGRTTRHSRIPVAWRPRRRRPGGVRRPPIGLPRHHLYVVVENNRAHLDHVLLRDLLRDDADARERYAALKRRNAQLANHDMDVYVAAKATLVAELLTRARAERGLSPETYWSPGLDRP